MRWWNNKGSIVPVVNWELGYLGTLFDELVGVIEELVKVVWIFGLTGNCCEGLVPDYCLLFTVLDALSNKMLMVSTADLTEDEAYLMLKQTGLCLIILFRQE